MQMPKTEVLPDPDATLTIGASFSVARYALGAGGLTMTYNPGTDRPEEFTSSDLTPTAQTLLALIHNELIALYRARRGYTP